MATPNETNSGPSGESATLLHTALFKQVSSEEAEELRRGISGATLETVEHTGHMIPLEQPKALARVMTEWLKTLS